MKRIVKDIEPEILRQYRENNPADDWKKGFYKNSGKDGYPSVRDCLIAEQGGLCVYCEIDLKIDENANNDFRVEHFYPDNPRDDASRVGDGINYSLHWDNLFGCCHGGNVETVVDKAVRYTAPNVHCDIDKGNQDWTGILLNPISDIPSYPSVFIFDEDGLVNVNQADELIPLREKISNSITLLNLHSKELCKLRAAIVDKLREEIELMLESGNSIENATYYLAQTYMSKNENGLFNSPFFSTIRWYLGPEADRYLKSVGY